VRPLEPRAQHEPSVAPGAHDPIWSPIALVEAVRIELGPLADPERAIALADRVIREWPADALVSEARAAVPCGTSARS